MKVPKTPDTEEARLQALRDYEVLDTPPEPAFDGLTELAAHIARVPIALVSLVDAGRQWFKSRYGLELSETARDVSLSGHVVASEAPLQVTDTFEDERFADNPLVVGEPRIRFYAGIPLQNEQGLVVGALCLIDHIPRSLTQAEMKMLGQVARQVVDRLELRRQNLRLDRQLREGEKYRRFFDLSLDPMCTANDRMFFEDLNPSWEEVLGWSRDELRAAPFISLVHPDDLASTLREASRLLEGATTVNFANRYRHKDGHWVPLAWVAVVKDGVFFASARDMTSYETKARALQASFLEVSEAKSRMQSILASANYAIIETMPDGTIREFNAAAERLLGYSAQELIGKATPAIIHDLEEVVARSKELSLELGVAIEPGFETFVAKARRGIPDECEWTYIRKDGSRFPVALSVTARFGPSGEILGFMGIANDLTSRKLAEGQLRQSEVLLNAVFAGMAEGMVIHDCSGAICESNLAAERILGLSRDQLLGRPSVDPRWASTHPDGSAFPGEAHPAMVALRTGEPQNDVQMVIAKPNGERALISINVRPIKLGSGSESADAVVATFRDITHPAKIEQAMRESETRWRSIIETAVDAIITIDEAGRIDRVNPAVERLFGYAPTELAGANVKVLMPSPYHEQHDGYLANYLRTGERKVIGIGREVTAARKDGSTFPAELAVSEFFLEGKRYFTGVIRDITDRKRVERLQSEFVSTVSHELRTPLTSIRGSLGLIAGGVLGELPAEVREYVDIALNNADRLVRLINDLLDMEKMQSGGMEFHLKLTDLVTAVRGAMEANAGFAASHGVRLGLKGEALTGEVLVDPDRLAQALTNLISNAVKFSPPDSQVELSVERLGGSFRVQVRDHGPGIPKEFEERIFSRFAQADSSSTRQKGGTGLGLSITKTIIEKMRGRVGFDSGVGEGALFFLELPRLHPVIEAPPGDADAPRVLVCEDDPDVAQLLNTTLKSAGFAVHTAPTLELARRLLAEHRYDGITLDLMLADGDATALISEIRAAEATRQIPIIIVSGFQGMLGQAAVLVTDVLVKPFDEKRLLALLQDAVAQSRNSQPRLLHVEDDPDIRRVVRRTLPEDWHIASAESLRVARQALSEAEFDVVLLDLSLPDGGGEELLNLVGRAQVVIFSAQEASASVSGQVSAALVKSRSTPDDVRQTIVSLLGDARTSLEHLSAAIKQV